MIFWKKKMTPISNMLTYRELEAIREIANSEKNELIEMIHNSRGNPPYSQIHDELRTPGDLFVAALEVKLNQPTK